MKKRYMIGFCMAFLVIVLASGIVGAEQFIVTSAPDSSSPNILDFQVSKVNYYTLSDFEGIAQEPYQIGFFNSAGQLVESSSLMTTVTAVPFNKDIREIRVYDELEFLSKGSKARALFEQAFSYCDNNGQCEPCAGPDCSLIENSLVCPDCKTGSDDGFCDLKRDGVCDPDCDSVDGDCEDCNIFCAFDDTTCKDLGGILCSGEEICMEGAFASGLMEDGEIVDNCCVDGFCMTEGFVDESTLTPLELEELEASVDEPPGDEPLDPDDVDEDTPMGGLTVGQLEEQAERPALLPEELLATEDSGIDTRLYIGIILGLLVLFILILIFVVHRKDSGGAHRVDTVAYVQQDLEAFFVKGYSRQQSRQSLLAKGYPPDLVDKEIRKKYGGNS